MKVNYDQTVTAAPADIFSVLTDESFLGSYASAAALEYDVDVHHGDGVTTTRVSRVLPTAGMPSVARRFVGPTLEVVEIVTWCAAGERTWHGDAAVDIAVHGRDARFRGRTAVQPWEDSARYTLSGVVTIKVPLVGSTVERLAADALVKAASAQITAAQGRLASR